MNDVFDFFKYVSKEKVINLSLQSKRHRENKQEISEDKEDNDSSKKKLIDNIYISNN